MVQTLTACFSQASMEDSDHQSIDSGAVVGSSDDLLTEVLLRLPAASILRFKSVSKHWHLLLSHTHFTQRYDNLLKSPGLFIENEYVPFDVENPSTPPFRSLDSYFDRPAVEIVQSCNGLLLCSTNLGPKGCVGAHRNYVFNPTTKQLARIPPVPGGHKIILFMGLAFHQTDCAPYKVICVRRAGVDLYELQIYSSDARKWKISIQSFSASPIHFTSRGVYWNRAVYWAPFSNDNYLYFKIDAQQLQTLPFPVGLMSSEIVKIYLGESRGHLNLIVHKKRQENKLRLNVYEMLSDHSGWFIKYQLQLDALPTAFSKDGYGFQVNDYVRGKEEEDTFLVLETPKKMITYNFHNGSFKQIYDLHVHYSSAVNRYTETLSSF